MYTVSPIFLQDDEGNELSMSIADRQGSAYRLTPILRHRDDMTEADAICIWESVKGRVDFSMSVFGLYGNPREMYKTKFPLWRAEEFHWLISHGFDMFGLIESGQAIRKEAGNG